MPEAEREAIFRKFYRGSVATSRALRGSGLGLAICKQIVDAHGGSISVSTAPQGGARFTISLPVSVSQ